MEWEWAVGVLFSQCPAPNNLKNPKYKKNDGIPMLQPSRPQALL